MEEDSGWTAYLIRLDVVCRDGLELGGRRRIEEATKKGAFNTQSATTPQGAIYERLTSRGWVAGSAPGCRR